MTELHEPARRTPIAADVDLCVVGGSATGAFAAIRAARMGLSVAIVEKHGFFGGTATAGLVSVWHSLFDTTGARRIIGGLTQEIIDRLDRRGAVHLEDPANPSLYAIFNSVELTMELDQLIVEAGVRVFLHARFVAALGEGGRCEAIVIEDASGRRAIRASAFVDATGSATLVRALGMPVRRPETLQPPTTCGLFGGLEALGRALPNFNLTRAVFDESNPHRLPPGFLWSARIPGLDDMTMVAGTRVHGTDGADADSLTRAEIEGRHQLRCIADTVREASKYAGVDVGLAATASHIGLRETRHAECLYTLTERDVLTGRDFDDTIALGSYRVDIHHADRGGLTFRYLDGREVELGPDGIRREGRWRDEGGESPTFYRIPYRCLVPRGARNVLVTGRSIDADEGAFGAVRVMVVANQTGEAAGLACALAIEQDCDVADVPLKELQRQLGDCHSE
jgi:hypothetical protein